MKINIKKVRIWFNTQYILSYYNEKNVKNYIDIFIWAEVAKLDIHHLIIDVVRHLYEN